MYSLQLGCIRGKLHPDIKLVVIEAGTWGNQVSETLKISGWTSSLKVIQSFGMGSWIWFK